MSCLKITVQIYFQSMSVPYEGEEGCNTGFWLNEKRPLGRPKHRWENGSAISVLGHGLDWYGWGQG